MFRPAESTPICLPGLGAAAALLLVACASPPAARPAPQAAPAEMARPGPAAPPTSSPDATAAALPAEALQALLAFADKLDGLSDSALQAEIDTWRGREGAAAWLRLALVHAQRQPPELLRAIELAQQAQQDASPEGQQLQPLARLLRARLVEQRRLEEHIDRQGRQLAEVQRRLDHSLDRLEALKAIERSLDRRPAPPRSQDR